MRSADSMMSIQVRVSVVIPMYNRRHCICRALDSVLGQTYVDFELIVVDDGSTDGSGDVVRQYSDPRIRLVTQANGGECAARNSGVAAARAAWTAFLDSDDEWMPRFLERTLAMIRLHPHVAAVFTNARCSEDAAPLIGPNPGGIVDDYLRFYVDNGGRAANSSSVVVRKSVLLAAGGFPVGVRWGGDVATWMRLAWSGEMAYVPEVLAHWHTDVADRVLKDGAAKIVSAPLPTIAAYDLWRREGRIPERLLPSSARMAQHMYLQHALLLSEAGQGGRARKVLREHCRPPLCGRGRYWKEFLRTLLPPPLFHRLGVWQKRLVRK